MRYALLVLLILAAPLCAVQQSIAFSETIDGELANPALLSADPDFGVSFRYDFEDEREELLVVRLPRWFAYAYDSTFEETTLSGGFELRRNLHLGFAWSDTPVRDARYDAGAVWRPLRQLSLAATAQDITQRYPDFTAGFAVRPYGQYATLFAQHNAEWDHGDEEFLFEDWQAGLQVQPLAGVILEGTYDSEENVQAFLRLDFGQFAAGYAMYGDPDDTGAAISRQTLSWSFHDINSIIPRHRVLHLVVDGDLSARSRGGLLTSDEPTLTDILLAIRNAGRDVSHIELTVRATDVPLADIEELREAIARSPKPVHVYLDDGDLPSLYLASAADRVFVAPGRPLQPGLFACNHRSYRGLMQHLGLRIDAAKYGELAPVDESLTADQLSQPVREHMQAMLLADWNDAWSAIEDERRLPADLRDTFREGVFLPAYAVDHGLADEMRPPRVHTQPGFLHKLFPPTPDGRWQREGEVAVIVLDGALTPGETRHPLLPEPPFGKRQTGAASILRQLEAASRDDDVKAIVLRIDSGGGECGACTQVFEKVIEVDRRKPVIVSVGSVCTSGAYYIATAGRKIFVDDHSLLAGLAVLGLSVDDSGMYGKIGVETERIAANSAPTADERFAVLPALQNTLLSRVASARNLPMLEVRELADGRVMRGAEAIDANLADQPGGLLDAIAYARNISGLSPNSGVRQSTASLLPDLSPITDPASQLPTVQQGFFYHSGWLRGN